MSAAQAPSDWQALYRLADEYGCADCTVTQIRGRHPIHPVADNGGAQAVCVHDDEWAGVVLADGTRVAIDD